MMPQSSPAVPGTCVCDVSNPQELQTAAASCTAAQPHQATIVNLRDCCTEQNASISSHRIKTHSVTKEHTKAVLLQGGPHYTAENFNTRSADSGVCRDANWDYEASATPPHTTNSKQTHQ